VVKRKGHKAAFEHKKRANCLDKKDILNYLTIDSLIGFQICEFQTSVAAKLDITGYPQVITCWVLFSIHPCLGWVGDTI
jgi:hypothetical protein